MRRGKFSIDAFVNFNDASETDTEDFVQAWIEENNAQLPAKAVAFDLIKNEVREDFNRKKREVC
ncbi:hypothetical protein [Microcystis phage Mel-JY01]